MGFEPGELVLELGGGSDVDQSLRESIVADTGNALIEDETNEVVDAVIIWWRDGDGDLEDELVDALTYLSESGSIWVLTPKAGRDGHVEPSDIQDAAPNVGLSQTSTFSVATDWTATRLVARKSAKR
ncbi:MAG: hypothetical protein RL428_715 [Actinomycetota bacterium]|jgi:hypothetical protein